jgi:hypothetical protein
MTVLAGMTRQFMVIQAASPGRTCAISYEKQSNGNLTLLGRQLLQLRWRARPDLKKPVALLCLQPRLPARVDQRRLGHRQQARLCFAQFEQGQVFSPLATAQLRRFAGWVAAAAFAAMLAAAVMSVVLSLNNPPGARHLAIGISSNHVFTLFFAGVVWLMADIIGRGLMLAEENERFV